MTKHLAQGLILVLCAIYPHAHARVLDSVSRGTGFNGGDEIILVNQFPHMVRCTIQWTVLQNAFSNKSAVQDVRENSSLRTGAGGSLGEYRYSCDMHPEVARRQREQEQARRATEQAQQAERQRRQEEQQRQAAAQQRQAAEQQQQQQRQDATRYEQQDAERRRASEIDRQQREQAAYQQRLNDQRTEQLRQNEVIRQQNEQYLRQQRLQAQQRQIELQAKHQQRMQSAEAAAGLFGAVLSNMEAKDRQREEDAQLAREAEAKKRDLNRKLSIDELREQSQAIQLPNMFE